MDRLNKSLEATHIYKSEAPQGASAKDVNVVDPNLLMAVMKGDLNANFDCESEDEVEDRADTGSEGARTRKKVSSSSDTDTSDKMRRAEKEGKLGQKAYKGKDFKKAVRHFKNAIDLNQKEVAHHFHLAEVKFEQKRYEECIEISTRAIKVGKENKGNVKKVAWSMVIMGRAKEKQRKFEEAKADIGKANRFLKSIAMVKLEKGKYYEALDFIHEAFQGFKMLSSCEKEYQDEKENEMMMLNWKVSIRYLCECTTCHDEADIKRLEMHIDDCIKKKDVTTALRWYLQFCRSKAKYIIWFFLDQANIAKEKKKWSRCHQLCDTLSGLIHAFKSKLSVVSGISVKNFEETFTEVSALQSKALRRQNKLGEDFDVMFLEELSKKQDDGCRTLMTYELGETMHPGMTKYPYETFLAMADFYGGGEVTVDEWNVFRDCARRFRTK